MVQKKSVWGVYTPHLLFFIIDLKKDAKKKAGEGYIAILSFVHEMALKSQEAQDNFPAAQQIINCRKSKTI